MTNEEKLIEEIEKLRKENLVLRELKKKMQVKLLVV